MGSSAHEEKGRIVKAVLAGVDEAKSAASKVVAAATDELTDESGSKAPSETERPGSATTTGAIGASNVEGNSNGSDTRKG